MATLKVFILAIEIVLLSPCLESKIIIFLITGAITTIQLALSSFFYPFQFGI